MELTKELLAKIKETKTVEELVALAKENEMELTLEEAEKYYAKFHQTGEMSDDELDNVAGGGCDRKNDACRKCGSYNIRITSNSCRCFDCGYLTSYNTTHR